MDTSCLKIVLALCLLAAHCFAANPTVFIPWTAPRGTGGITVTTNPAAGTFTISGAALTGIVPPWTNNGTYIFPLNQTNAIHINRLTGGIIIGTNGIGTVVDSQVFRAVFDSTMGDPSAATWTLEANDTGAGTYGGSLLNVNAFGDTYFALYNHKGLGFGLYFNPNEVSGVTPFALNSSVNQTSGSLLSVSNFDVGKFDVAHNGMIWSATNRFAFATTTNVWPLTNAVAGQLLTSAGGAGAQMYWSTVSGGSGPSFADLVWTNTGTAIQPTGIGANTNSFSITAYGGFLSGKNDGGGGFFSRLRNDPDWGNGGADFVIESGSTSGGTPGNDTAYVAFQGAPDSATLAVGTYGIGDLFFVNPTAAAGTTPYTSDTSLAHTNGNLVEWKNLGVTQLSLSFSNGVATPAITAYGAGSAPWQFGMATNTVDVLLGATNVVEIVVNGVAYLLPAKLK